MRTLAGKPATLALADGTVWHGRQVGASGTVVAPILVHTALSGYQELLTDPSLSGQFICFTAVHIGNGGITTHDGLVPPITAAGVVVREMARYVSNHLDHVALSDALIAQGRIGISDVDTRAIAQTVRNLGPTKAVISTQWHNWEDLKVFFTDQDTTETPTPVPAVVPPKGEAVIIEAIGTTVHDAPVPFGVDQSDGKATSTPPANPLHVALIDLGSATTTAHLLSACGARVSCLNPDTDPSELVAGYDGVVFSNGPETLATDASVVALVKTVLKAKVPVFGIGLGHLLIGQAVGGTLTSLGHGHFGTNHPITNRVADYLATHHATGEEGNWLAYLERERRGVDMVALSHRFVITQPPQDDTTRDHTAQDRAGGTGWGGPFGLVIESHRNMTDLSIAGIALVDQPAFSVQFNADASPGPHEGRHVFDQFAAMMAAHTSRTQEA